MSELTGLTAAITGAGSGIGLATARNFAAAGARVFGLDLTEGSMAGVAEWIRLRRGLDASRSRAPSPRFVSRVSVLDILVNNAGIGAVGTVEDGTDDEWQRVLNVNVVGMARVTKAALPLLRASRSAAIVNTGSLVATVGVPQRAVYAASKGAVQALTSSMAADLVHEGIRVNSVNPGTADTPWVGRLLDLAADPEAERAALEHRQPAGRLVTPDEVAPIDPVSRRSGTGRDDGDDPGGGWRHDRAAGPRQVDGIPGRRDLRHHQGEDPRPWDLARRARRDRRTRARARRVADADPRGPRPARIRRPGRQDPAARLRGDRPACRCSSSISSSSSAR